MPIKANTTQLEARPIVFINSYQAFCSPDVAESLEWVDLQKKMDSLGISAISCNPCNPCAPNEELTKLYESQKKIELKLMAIARNIAKRLGACSVLEIGRYVHGGGELEYVDPAYDITREAIDTLNKEYLPERATVKPTTSSSPSDMLHKAILNDSAEEINRAVATGASLNHEKDGKSPLWWAVLHKKFIAVKTLLECGAATNEDLIDLAIKQGMIKAAVLIAQTFGANLNADYSGNTLLQHATKNNDYEAVLLLIKTGVNISGYTAITTYAGANRNIMEGAVEYNQSLELIQSLLDSGFNVNDMWNISGGSLPLVLYSSADILRLVIKNGGNVNHVFESKYEKNSTWTPLFGAIRHGNKMTVKILLDAGANINQQANPYPNRQKSPLTPLAFALSLKQVDIVELLLERGAIQ